MSSPIFSNIFQHNTEMQRRHKEEQWLQACLKEVVEACCIEHTTYKTRKVAKVKTREKAEK